REAVEELSQSRQEPDWLLEMRLRALDTFESLPMPDQRTEGWRRTSLRDLDLDALEMDRQGARVDIRGDAAGRVLKLEDALNDARLAPLVRRHFGQVVLANADRLVALHYALFNTGVVVWVPRGSAVSQPIWISYNFDQAGRSLLVHTLVIAEDETDMNLIEDHQGRAGLSVNVVEQVLGANAHVRYVNLQRFSHGVWSFSTQRAHLAQDASLRTLNVALGGRLARNSVQVALDGRGSQADLLGLVDAVDHQHVDFQTLQEHSGDQTRSDLVIHDALRDASSANFTGLIRINKSAHQTASSQEQKNILLSESAKADSDPKLEILNNDVIRCTHGAAVGPVDPELIFYLQSRGLDQLTAERLVVEGFFRSTLAKLELPEVEEQVWTAVAEGWAGA
ncbi:MAG TPA: Fe-S cluster assembly protein SufD, partial [Chloroflexota bacterium]